MIISAKKTNVMHIHKTTRTNATTDADVAKFNIFHKCGACICEFTKLRGLKMHMARWCDGGRTQRSCVGSLTDQAVKSSKRRASEAPLDKVVIGSDPPLENVPHFRYLGWLRGDGCDEAYVGPKSSIVDRAVGVQLMEPYVGRSPTIRSNETPALPRMCVLVPHTLLRGLDSIEP